MTSSEPTGSGGCGFTHQAAIYTSEQEFLDTVLPFIRDGLDSGEPVLLITTPVTLHRVARALGRRRAKRMDCADTALFGHKPVQRVTAFRRYWDRCRDAGATRIRVLAEPVWAGRPADRIDAWERLEACLNLVMADTEMFMICPYDSRVLPPRILTSVRRTHPWLASCGTAAACADHVDPRTFLAGRDAVPLSPPPADAARFAVETGTRALRAFVTDQARRHGMDPQTAAMLALAASEAAVYLRWHAAETAPGREETGPPAGGGADPGGGPAASAMVNAATTTAAGTAVETAVGTGAGEAAGAAAATPRNVGGDTVITCRMWCHTGVTVCDLHRAGGRITDPALGLHRPGLSPRPGDGIHLAHHVCDRLEIRSTAAGCSIRLYGPERPYHVEPVPDPAPYCG